MKKNYIEARSKTESGATVQKKFHRDSDAASRIVRAAGDGARS